MLVFMGNEVNLSFEHKEKTSRSGNAPYVNVIFGDLTMDLKTSQIDELRAWLNAID